VVFDVQKYTAVQNLVRRNPWSMNIDDPALAHRFKLQTLDVQREKSLPLFRFFADYQRKGILPSLFNSVILDPPKKKVMLYIYSKYFLENLAGTIMTTFLVCVACVCACVCAVCLTIIGVDVGVVMNCRVDEEGRCGGSLHAAWRTLALVLPVPGGARADVRGHPQV
jgi:hypothetical protein